MKSGNFIAKSFYFSKLKNNSNACILLLPEHGPTREGVVVWCKEQRKIETQNYKEEQQAKAIQFAASERITSSLQKVR